MSLGGPAGDPDRDPMHKAIKGAVAKGVVFCVAAGNESTGASKSTPAAYPEVITVSAIVDTNGAGGGGGPSTSYGADDTFADFSNFGPRVAIAAPGVRIYSTYKGSAYATLSGTSMATPHVTGAAARWIASQGRSTPDAVKAGILGAATRQDGANGFTGDPDAFHEPLVNVSSY
jgi:subtilisin family serine protease